MPKIQVSVGVPAFNEENNIIELLTALSKQKQINIKIKEILVYSDGSTDQTPKILRKIKSSKVKLKLGYSRLGQQIRQNQIIKNFSGDILVFIEADTLPASSYTIENLVKPFLKDKSGKIGMVVGCPKLVKPQTFLEKILFFGYQAKYDLFAEWNQGRNVYACGGHSMKALSRQFTNKLRWPKDVPEDAYTYLRIKTLNFKLKQVQTASAYMRNVTNVEDRIRQVKKYIGGKKALGSYFSQDLIEKEYKIPKTLFLKYFLKAMIKNPFWISLYFLEIMYNRLLTLGTFRFDALYTIYNSSKTLKTS